ncbi:hypothetical protein BCR33DRAFT_716441 [Rhizoclosmatium globosum]|uniref:DOMON domain-containing protein n=1 Tax=Rhizoclosmatium globosum TaxID=329046 RepID=A0A1Y2CDG6_9FUNG|nr:hypothetical protein BCR33DRAFT_716441 [Rhizoclosmatium globosum]|eukprot:ORY45100.1 hypothetical protein BCR33DRAFT_716441 [Rhizoclosmatium globosum]
MGALFYRVFLSLYFASLIYAQSTYCSSGNSFCATIKANNNTIELSGWAGIGLKTSRMAGAKMVVGWMSKSAPIISVRQASGHFLPNVSPDSVIVQAAVDKSVLVGTPSIAYSFNVPYGKASDYFGATAGNKANFIYAASGTGPDDPTGSFSLVIPTASAPVSSVPTTSILTSLNISTSIFNNAGTILTSSFPASVTPPPNTTQTGPAIGFATSNYCSDASNLFCLFAYRDFAAGTVTFTVQTSYTGWVGFGIGSSMTNSVIFVGWTNSSGSPVVSQRNGAAYVLPPVSQTQQFSLVPAPTSATIMSTAKIVWSVQLPVSFISQTGATSFIYGLSQSPPKTPSDPASSFPQHSERGIFTLDVSTVGNTTGINTSPPNYILYHGICMFLAWCICPAVGVFIARYMKTQLGIYGITALMALGLLFVELSIVGGRRFSGDSVHGAIGIAIAFGLYPCQVVLGYVSNAMFSPERKEVPIQDKVHWWVGRLTESGADHHVQRERLDSA